MGRCCWDGGYVLGNVVEKLTCVPRVAHRIASRRPGSNHVINCISRAAGAGSSPPWSPYDSGSEGTTRRCSCRVWRGQAPTSLSLKECERAARITNAVAVMSAPAASGALPIIRMLTSFPLVNHIYYCKYGCGYAKICWEALKRSLCWSSAPRCFGTLGCKSVVYIFTIRKIDSDCDTKIYGITIIGFTVWVTERERTYTMAEARHHVL
jgi:hypothetical protein